MYPQLRQRRSPVQRTRKPRITIGDMGRPSVVTVLEPSVRDILDRASDGDFSKVHVASVPEASRAIYEHGATTLLFSAEAVKGPALSDLAQAIRKHPAVTPIVVLGDNWASVQNDLLELGARGVRNVVNLAEREGWQRLRLLIERSGCECTSLLSTSILRSAQDASEEMRRFLGTVISTAPTTLTVRVLAQSFKIEPSTLTSRFFRASLPAPKLYLSMTRLLYAAWLLEKPGVSIASTSHALHFSSPQSFARHIRTSLGLTAGEFRRELPVRAALEHYRERLITPYAEILSTFRPFSFGGG